MNPRALGLILALGSLAHSQDAALYRVSGTVTDAATRHPIGRVRLTLSHITDTGLHFSAVTANDGRFELRVPEGKYHLRAQHARYPSQGWNQPPGRNFNTAVITGPDKLTTDIAIQMHRGGAISGTVTDDVSDPVADAQVYALRLGLFHGRRQVWMVGRTETGSVGEYRLSGLGAGSYYLAVAAVPWFASGPMTVRQMRSAPAPSVAWPMMFSGNTPDARAASLISVAEGAEVKADFNLPAASGSLLTFNVEGHLGDSSIALIQRGPEGFPRAYRSSPPYRPMLSVFPGRYEVLAHLTSGFGGALHRVIDVTTGRMVVDLGSRAVPTVSGKVLYEGEKPKSPDLTQLLLLDEHNVGMPIVVQADGTFSQPSMLWDGRYRVSYGGGEYRVRSVKAGGAGVDGTTLDVIGSNSINLEIVLSDDVAKIEGVLRRGNIPVAGAAVMIVPRQRDAAETMPEDQTDSDGSFNLPGLPVGDYDLLILESGEHIEFTRPDVLAKYRDQLRRVRIEKRGAQPLEIDLDQPLEKSAR